MAALPSTYFFNRSISLIGLSDLPSQERSARGARCFTKGTYSRHFSNRGISPFLKGVFFPSLSKTLHSKIPKCSGPSNISSDNGKSSNQEKIPFGYTRKDVLLIGLGLTVVGIGLKSGLEYLGVDPLQAGNVVQLVLVLGLTVGWISTYIFRVSNKEMTYAQQLRDYEDKVMQAGELDGSRDRSIARTS
ncbi:uncharacterized protein LOC127262729 isoform X2 [Andrographis paniculata]|uniref:uncharacterized protein LOC127262729 isoform X2 n=1 Tax=Andrographis paniculata TaxID=175694 RepID=UPI0021E7C42D|nr:uncharacterized protein LOC127262729 isoform X2 [Andrographis paniculata]